MEKSIQAETSQAVASLDAQQPSKSNNPWNADTPVSYSEMWFGADDCVQYVQNKIAGESIHWLTYAIRHYMAPAVGLTAFTKPPRDYKCLILGANEGFVERSLRAHGFIGKIVASDIADKALKRAEAASQALGYTDITYVVADLNTVTFDDKFDFIIAEGVLHHIEQTERCLEMLNQCLTEDGVMLAIEFVGPVRFQLPPEQVRWINAALAVVPKVFRPFPRDLEEHLPATAAENAIVYYVAPSEESIINFDPSEAICGPKLKALLPEVFELVEKKGFGGTLLSYMTGHFDFKRCNHDEFARSWLKILIQIEETLIQNGILEDEFVFYVLKKK